MKELRAQETATPGFKQAFLKCTEPAKKLMNSVFHRLTWNDSSFKVDLKQSTQCTKWLFVYLMLCEMMEICFVK